MNFKSMAETVGGFYILLILAGIVGVVVVTLLPFFVAAVVGVGGALLVAGTVSWLINSLFGGK